jgi:hypothetical protein
VGTGEKRTLYKGSWKTAFALEEKRRADAPGRCGPSNARVESGARAYTSPSSRPTFSNAASATPTSSSVSAAFMIVRIRAFSLATIG